jgi:beta-lactamase regulating signal transducer with metallopeptidase domain
MMILSLLFATIATAGLGYGLALAAEPRLPARSGVWIWRAARLAAVSPPLVAALGGIGSALASRLPAGALPIAERAVDPVTAAPVPVFDLTLALTAVSGAASRMPDWLIAALAGAYAAGVLAAGLRMAVRRRAVRRILAASRPAGPQLEQVAARWRSRLGLAGDLCPIRLVDANISPFVSGLRPVIVAPERLEAGASAEFAIAHECMHVRRGDERDRFLGEGLAALLWFNPFVAGIERRLAGARELACDADLLEQLQPGQARAYAAAIADAAPPAPASAFLTDLHDLRRRRIEAVLKPAASRAWPATLAAAAGLALCAAAPGAALALAFNSAGLQDAEPVRQVSPRVLSEPVGEVVLQIQTLMDDGEHEAVLARTQALLDGALTAYERSVVLRLEANALFQLDRYGDSVARFEQAIETGALTPEEEAAMYLNALQLHMVLENYALGAEYADRYLAYDPPLDTRRKITLAQIFVQSERYEDALPLAEDGLAELEEPTADQLALLEFIYQELGREADRDRVRARREAMDEG